MFEYEDVLALVVAPWMNGHSLMLAPDLDAIHKRFDANAVMRPSYRR